MCGPQAVCVLTCGGSCLYAGPFDIYSTFSTPDCAAVYCIAQCAQRAHQAWCLIHFCYARESGSHAGAHYSNMPHWCMRQFIAAVHPTSYTAPAAAVRWGHFSRFFSACSFVCMRP